MDRRSAFLLAAALATAGSATAEPAMPFIPGDARLAVERPFQSDSGGVILVEGRGRGGAGGQRAGGGGQRAAGRANPGSFNSNSFHRDVSNTRNANARPNRNVNAAANRNVNVNAAANRNVNVNANRNANVAGRGGCCYGNYNEGPSWGGVAAGVATGAVLGAAVSSAANSPTYAAPPPTYPPGYVSPPPY